MRVLKTTLLTLVIGLSLAALTTASAGFFSDSSGKESNRVEEQQSVYIDSQPVPFFDWSLERHIFTELYKARNEAVTTYSYVRNWQGEIIFSCESMGYPLPANMQLTNPEEFKYKTTIPQPEPNGLYSSPSSVGTYIFCTNDDGTVSPSYFEENVETHLSPLDESKRNLKGDGELKIDVKE